MLRNDFNDQIFRTEKEKYNAITNKILECNKKDNQYWLEQQVLKNQKKFHLT